MKKYQLLFLLSILWSIVCGQEIRIDGQTSEWTNEHLIATDIEGGNQLDIERLYMQYDETYLYLRVDVSQDIILQRESELVLIIDSDDNTSTGFPIKSLGTEFSFYFTGNNGFVNPINNSISINHDDVGFFVAPAFESSSFEIAINRNLGSYGPTLDGVISLAIFNNIPNGDILPNTNGVQIDLTSPNTNTFPQASFTKPEDTDFRLVSLNSRFDQLFESESFEAYNRIFKSTNPDIIAFQEIYDHSSAQTADLIETFLPSDAGETWYHEKVGADIILVSRYPIIFDDWVSGNGIFVLDVDGKEVSILNVHLPCCENDQGRDEEIDGILRYWRNIMNGNETHNLDPNSPLFIVGDFNLVGDGQQLDRLLTGNIKNNSVFGPDFEPDWFSGNLIDAAPVAVNSNLAYTWYNEFSSYTGGRLDYILYTPSSIYEVNKYVIDTRIMSQGDLFLSGLSQTDSQDCSDHLMVVTDWSFNPISDTQDLDDLHNLSVFPIPFDQSFKVSTTDGTLLSNIKLFDINGQLIQSYESIYAKSFPVNSSHLQSGFYFLDIRSNNGSRKMYRIVKK